MDEVQLLKKLGLTEYESRAYTALAKLGPANIKEIVRESKLPRNKTYEALEKLEQKNRVISLPVSPKKYKIANPELFREEIKELESSMNELIKLITQPKKDEHKDLFWMIKGQKATMERILSENEKCEKEIAFCSNLSRPMYKNMRILEQTLKRGVNVKIICKYKKENESLYKEYLKMGAKLRVFNEKEFGPLLPRIGIFDNKTARLTIGRPEVKNEEEYITLWTESKAFSQMLKKHFMNMWKQCTPIKKYFN